MVVAVGVLGGGDTWWEWHVVVVEMPGSGGGGTWLVGFVGGGHLWWWYDLMVMVNRLPVFHGTWWW